MHHLIDSLVSLAIGAAAGAGAMWMTLRRSKSPDKRSISTASFAQESSTGLPSRSCDGTEKPDATFSVIPLLAGLIEEDEIVQEQLTRNIQFFGREGQKKICESFVVVVGLGVGMSECCSFSFCVCVYACMHLQSSQAASLSFSLSPILNASSGRRKSRRASVATQWRGQNPLGRLRSSHAVVPQSSLPRHEGGCWIAEGHMFGEALSSDTARSPG